MTCGLVTLDARLPAFFVSNGKAAAHFFEFSTGNIRNKHSRPAYYKAVFRFLEWCEARVRKGGDLTLNFEHSGFVLQYTVDEQQNGR